MLSLWGGLGVQLYRGSLLADPAWCHYCPLLGTAQPARIGPPGDGDPVGCLLPELLPNILVPNAFGSHSLCPPWSPWAGTWSHCLGASHTLAWYWSGLGGCSHVGLTTADWALCSHQLGLGPPWAGPGHVCGAAALRPLGTRGWSWAVQLGMVGHKWTWVHRQHGGHGNVEGQGTQEGT